MPVRASTISLLINQLFIVVHYFTYQLHNKKYLIPAS